jgi:hypothetical protein
MKSSSARERVEEERVESRVGNGVFGQGDDGSSRPRDQNINRLDTVRNEGGQGGIVSTYKMQNNKDRITRRLTTEDARDTCGS